MYYAPVTDSMKVGPGGGNASEGEFIELVEVPVKDSLQFVMNDSLDRPSGMIQAVLWFHTPGMVKDAA